LERYRALGDSPGTILLNSISSPILVLSLIPLAQGVFYLLQLLVPALPYLSLKRSWIFIGVLPILILKLLSSSNLQRDIRFHYSLPFLPFFALIGISKKASWGPIYVFSLSLLIHMYGFYRVGINYPIPWFSSSERIAAISESRAFVPDSCSVLATNYLLPSVAERDKVGLFGAQFDGRYFEDFGVIWVEKSDPWGDVVSLLREIKGRSKWKEVYNKDGIVLFKRDDCA
jgi:uncharacterized membrane protein